MIATKLTVTNPKVPTHIDEINVVKRDNMEEVTRILDL